MQWVCEICGYVHDDDELPGSCPVCGAPRSKFTKKIEKDPANSQQSDSEDVDYFERDLFGDIEE